MTRSEHPVRDTSRIVLPPANFQHEQEKIQKRWPAAVDYIVKHRLNEFLGGSQGNVGIIVQGGLYNTLLRALELLGLADSAGNTQLPLYVLNVTYPLIDEEIVRFCRGKTAVLIVEEGQPEYIEQHLNTVLHRAELDTKVVGKEVLPRAGEYTGQVLERGAETFLRRYAPGLLEAPPYLDGAADPRAVRKARREPSKQVQALAGLLPARPAGFCTGCPERPIFTAMKLLQREIGPMHISCDIGCHLFSISAAVQPRQHHHGLRPRRRGRIGLQRRERPARHGGHGRWRILAQRPHLGRGQRRCSTRATTCS